MSMRVLGGVCRWDYSENHQKFWELCKKAEYNDSFTSQELRLLITAVQSDSRCKSTTLLIAACKIGEVDLALGLIKNDTDFLKENEWKITAGHWAATNGLTAVIEALNKKNPAYKDLVDENGETPLHRACSDGQGNTALMLVEQGANLLVKDNQGLTPAHYALSKGKTDLVEDMVKLEPKLLQETLLHTACEYRLEEFAFWLIEQGADPKQKNSKGNTAGHIACLNGLERFVLAMLDEKKCPPEPNNYGSTWLHQACHGKQNGIALELMNRGASLSDENHEGKTPVHIAAERGITSLLTTMLKSKRSLLNQKTKSGKTLLEIACNNQHEDLALFLIKKGIKIDVERGAHFALSHKLKPVLERMLDKKPTLIDIVDEEGQSLLYNACQYGEEELALMLINRGANLKLTDAKGRSALYQAYIREQKTLVEVMVKKEPSLITGAYSERMTFLHVELIEKNLEFALLFVQLAETFKEKGPSEVTPAEFAILLGQRRILTAMLDKDPNLIKDRFQRELTLLHFACAFKKKKLAKLLIERGADCLAPVPNGFTPFETAINYELVSTVEEMIEKHPEIAHSSIKNGMKPIHLAAFAGSLKMVKFFRKREPSMGETPDENGNTLLHLACASKNPDTGKLINYLTLERNADLQAKNKDGLRPMHVAADEGKFDLAKQLYELEKSRHSKAAAG